MSEVCSNLRVIPKIVSALCLLAVFQFVACAQTTSDGSNLPQTEANPSAQAIINSSSKLIENSTTAFDFMALSNQMLCSPNALLNILKLTAVHSTPPPFSVPVSEPKVQFSHPQVTVPIRLHEQKLSNVSFAEPDKDSKHAPRMFRATAYAIHGRTRSGARTEKGVIAADPRVLPLGTIVQVNAGLYTGVYTVHDTGGAIKGNRVDVWMPTKKEARRFGRRNIKLVVLRYPGQNKQAAQK